MNTSSNSLQRRLPIKKQGEKPFPRLQSPGSNSGTKVSAVSLRSATLYRITFSQWLQSTFCTQWKKTIWRGDESYKWRQNNYGAAFQWVRKDTPSGRVLLLGGSQLGSLGSQIPQTSLMILSPEYNYPSPMILLVNYGICGGPWDPQHRSQSQGEIQWKTMQRLKLTRNWQDPDARNHTILVTDMKECLMLSDEKTLFYKDVTFLPHHCLVWRHFNLIPLSFHIYTVTCINM